MFDPMEDPLALALKGRAREKRLAASLQGLQPIGGPLPDQNWDALSQAMDEQGVTGIQAGASPEGSKQLRGFGGGQLVNKGGFSQGGAASMMALRQLEQEAATKGKKPKTALQTEAADFYKQKYPGLG